MSPTLTPEIERFFRAVDRAIKQIEREDRFRDALARLIHQQSLAPRYTPPWEEY